jgi:hypothetical protein
MKSKQPNKQFSMIKYYPKTLFLYSLFFFCIKINAQTITLVNPNNVNRGASIDVSISGQNTIFGQGTSTNQVWFNQGSSTLYSSSVTLNSATNVLAHFDIPNTMPLGIYTTNITNGSNGDLSLSNSFTINPNPTPPTIINVSPNVGALGQTLTVDITGQNTNFNQGTGTLVFNQGSSTLFTSNYTYNSNTQMGSSVFIPPTANLGFYDVSYTNAFDGTVQLINGFLVAPPCGTITLEIVQQPCENLPAIVNIIGGTAPYTININGDIIENTSSVFSYLPSNFGTYTIVSVTDFYGCSSGITSNNTLIYQSFTASLTAETVCAGVAATFTTLVDTESGIANSYFTYGDGNFGSINSHVYSNGGSYSPSVLLQNNLGCFLNVPISTPLTILPKPEVSVISSTDASCGAANGAFEISLSGTPSLILSITGPSGFTSTNITNNNLASGVYNVNVEDGNGCTNFSSVQINSVSQQTNITGNITSASQTVNNAVVNLYNLSDEEGELSVSYSTTSDVNGNYSFSNLVEGEYILSATPPSSLPLAIRTYYPSFGVWYLANTLNVSCTSQATANINLINGVQLIGNNNASGTIQDISGEPSNLPVEGVEVLALNTSSNQFVSSSTSNSNGQYSFSGLVAGNYSIIVDIPGLNLIGTHNVSVSSNQTASSLNYYTDTIARTINDYYETVGEKFVLDNSISGFVFPNPFSQFTTINYSLTSKANVTIEVFNLLGNKIETIENSPKLIGNHQIIFDATNYGKGIYFIQMNVNKTKKTFKVVCTE